MSAIAAVGAGGHHVVRRAQHAGQSLLQRAPVLAPGLHAAGQRGHVLVAQLQQRRRGEHRVVAVVVGDHDRRGRVRARSRRSRSSSQPRGIQRAPGTWPAAKRSLGSTWSTTGGRADARSAASSAGETWRTRALGLGHQRLDRLVGARGERLAPPPPTPSCRRRRRRRWGSPSAGTTRPSPRRARCRRSRRRRCRCARPRCRPRAGRPGHRASTRSRGCGRPRTRRACARRSGRPSRRRPAPSAPAARRRPGTARRPRRPRARRTPRPRRGPPRDGSGQVDAVGARARARARPGASRTCRCAG